MKKEVLIDVKGLRKDFPIVSGVFRKEIGTIKALSGVDFTIYKGKVLGMVGESGCGKSTAGRAAIRLIEPTAGEITFKGIDVLSLSKEDLRRFRLKAQIVFQDPYASLNPRKRVGDAIGEPLKYHGLIRSQHQLRDRVAEVLSQVGLTPDIINRFPHEFSGGQQQRICIGRSIALNPEFLVCDEALSSLDMSVQAQMINLLLDLKEELNLSYLFISHDLSVVRHIADEVIVLYLGKVMEKASTQELFANPKHPYTQALLSAIPKLHPDEKKERIVLKGEIPSASAPPSGCPFRTRCPYAKPICALPPPHQIVMDKKTGKNDHHYFCILTVPPYVS